VTAVVLSLLALQAPIPPARAAFQAATELGRAGRHAEAAAAYETVARDFPDDELADDALAEAAQLHEEKLDDPEGALRLYTLLTERYPHSRLSRRAGNRAAFLRASLAAGPEPLRIYNQVVQGYARRPHAESIARMEDLVRRFPRFPLLGQALFWLGQAYQQERRWDDALRAYSEVQARLPQSEWAARAQKGIGDLWLERGQYARARAAFEALAARGPEWVSAAEAGRAAVRGARWRRDLEWACGAVFALFVLGYGLRARRVRPLTFPLELKYYLPVAAAFVLAAATEHRAILRATSMLAGAGALIVFLVGQGRLRGRTGARALHVIAITAAVAAIFVLAVQSQHLTDMMLETLRAGAER